MTSAAGLTQMQLLSILVEASQKEAVHCLTISELAERLSCDPRVVSNRIQYLLAKQFVMSVRLACYAPTPAGHARHREGGEITSGPARGSIVSNAVIRKTQQARLWKALRTAQKATIDDITQMAAKPGEHERTKRAARTFLSRLMKAGYVVKLPRKRRSALSNSRPQTLYFLIRNSGALPPKLYTDDEGQMGLKDRNTDEFFVFGPTPKRMGASS